MPILYEHVFSVSPEVAITAQKKSSRAQCFLLPWPAGPGVLPYSPGATIPTGTDICVRVGVTSPTEGNIWLPGKSIRIWRRIGAGTPVLIATVTTPTPGMTYDYKYTVMDAGVNTFWSEFLGDAYYEGCRSRALAYRFRRSRLAR